jgi:hypothetical protein
MVSPGLWKTIYAANARELGPSIGIGVRPRKPPLVVRRGLAERDVHGGRLFPTVGVFRFRSKSPLKPVESGGREV